MRVRSAAFVFVLSLLLLLAAATGAARAEALDFLPKVDYGTGAGPQSVAVGDFDRDGIRDLVTANAGASTVSVLLGDGSGGFGAKNDFTTGANPASVAVGDFNGDGKQDLATANYGANAVSVLLGNGSGGFGAKSDFATGSLPISVAVGDVNRDGKPDLVTANDSAADTVSVLLGDGSGGFGAKSDFATGSLPWSVAVADLNRDGKPDLVTADHYADAVSVLLQPPTTTITGPTASSNWKTGTTQTVSWTIDPAVSTGEFRVWLVSSGGTWYVGKQVLPTAGLKSYSTSVTVSVPAGTGYKAYVYWRPLAGSGAWLATAQSAAFTVTDTTPAVTITAPTASASWPSGSTQTVSWTASPAVSGGEFRIWLVSSGGTWYVGKQVLPTAGLTSYSTSVAAGVPAASGYKAYVYWRPTVGSGAWLATAQSAAFTVTPLNITAPTAVASWPSGSTQSVSWTMNPAVSTGEFRIWLVSSGGTWYVGKQVLPTAGLTSYSTSFAAGVPAGSGYRAYVYYRPTVGSGTWTATAQSAAFTVTPLNITSPTASSSWKTGSAQSVSWTINPAVSTGEFRIWLVSSGGTWYVGKQVLPTAGLTSYSTSITVSPPAATGYKAYVYWRPVVGSGAWAATAQSAAFAVTP